MESCKRVNLCALGGGGEVGANCFELSFGGHQILLDCGTHPKKEGECSLPAFDLLTRTPEAYIITHAHVDHCGAVPWLARMYPGVHGYATLPTARIMDRMLHNSVSVMETIAKERGIAEYPLFEHSDVGYALRFLETAEYREPFYLRTPDPVEVQFIEAGHVLGAASVLIRLPEHTIFYTGDICKRPQALVGGYKPLDKSTQVDTLIIESTQGASNDESYRSYRDEIEHLGDAVRGVLLGGGSVLIPSFALGRTQEMVNILADLQERGVIPQVPIHTAGLGRAIYELYSQFSNHLMPHAVLRPLDQFERLGDVWNPSVVERLLRQPSIIVATSGMMVENTPSALVAQQMVQQSHHGIFFVGYLDQDTLGHKLLHAPAGTPLQYELNRPPVEKVLENIRQFRFSAHATRSELAAVVDRINPKNVVYIHGDPNALDWMEQHTGGGRQTFVPAIGQTITIEA